MINTFRNFAAYTVLIASLIVGKAYADEKPATTSRVSAEVMAGHESSTLDVVAKGDIAPRFKFLLRNRDTWNYDPNAIDVFALIDLGYNLVDLLDVIAEVQFTQDSELVPRVGARYFHEFGDLSLFLLSTTSIKEEPDCDLNLIVQYMPKISKRARLYISLEHLTNVSKEGHNFSLQRARLGLDVKGYQFGAATDFKETGNKGELDYNVGGFVSKSF